jgi:hypothetical protein
VFTPALLQYVGTLDAWLEPSDGEITDVWDAVFPDYAVSSEPALAAIVAKLVSGLFYPNSVLTGSGRATTGSIHGATTSPLPPSLF